MGNREILLLSAGVILIGVTVWRQNQLANWQNDPTRQAVTLRTLAPRFTLPDQNRKIVKLERLLGRHQIVIVFFDAELGVDQDPRTKVLLENFTTIDAAGIEIIAVGTATPFANEEAEKRLGYELPFPVITDIDMNDPQPTPAHRLFGRIDRGSGEPLTGLFLIERDGSLPVGQDGFPIPMEDEQAVLKQVAQGKWLSRTR